MFAVEAIGGTAGGLEGNWGQVGLQLWGIAATLVYAAAATYVILQGIDLAIGLRVDADAETEELDIAIHGEAVP